MSTPSIAKLTLNDLMQLVENDAQVRGAWPRSPDQAALGYYYAYGQLLAELEGKWQWDRKLTRGRYYRGSVQAALTYLLRAYLLLRLSGPLSGVGRDIPVHTEYMGGNPIMTALVNMRDVDMMLQRPALFLGYVASLCKEAKIYYANVILDLGRTGPVWRKQ